METFNPQATQVTQAILKIEFTEQEIQALVSLLDSGLKSQGLQAAVAAAVIYQKIQAACVAAKPK